MAYQKSGSSKPLVTVEDYKQYIETVAPAYDRWKELYERWKTTLKFKPEQLTPDIAAVLQHCLLLTKELKDSLNPGELESRIPEVSRRKQLTTFLYKLHNHAKTPIHCALSFDPPFARFVTLGVHYCIFVP